MESATDSVELLHCVFPVIENDALLQATSNPTYQGFFTELRLQVTILKLQLSNVQPRIETSRSIAFTCRPILRSILEFWEDACFHPLHQSRHEAGIEQFPKLEDMRDSHQLPQGAQFRYDLENADEILENFDKWIEALTASSKDLAPKTSDQEKSPTPSNLVRESAKVLKEAVDKLLSCCHETSHDCMLFLATQHQIRENHPYVAFDLLYKTEELQLAQWHESKVHVILHQDRNTKVQFNLSDSGVPPAPQKRDRNNPIRSLCSHTRANNGPYMCINMRLEDSRLYKTTSGVSGINKMQLGPHQTFRSMIQGKSIISTASKIKLAVLAAYTVLHFSGSTWLPRGWDKTYFYLLKAPQERSPMLMPLLAACEHFKSKKASYVPGKYHEHPDLLQLGVLLLEIFLKKPIEKLREDRDIASTEQSDTDTDWFTANRKWDETFWDMHEGYADAVDACLSTSIDVPSPPYESPKDSERYANRYCAYIYEMIIAPLERELYALCKIGPEELDNEIKELRSSGPAKEIVMQGQTKRNVRLIDQTSDVKITAEISAPRASITALQSHGDVKDKTTKPEEPPRLHVDIRSQEIQENSSAKYIINSSPEYINSTSSPEKPLPTSSLAQTIQDKASHSEWGQLPPVRLPQKDVANSNDLPIHQNSTHTEDGKLHAEEVVIPVSAQKKRYWFTMKFKKKRDRHAEADNGFD